MTSLTITHDMVSAWKVAERIAMLYKGRTGEVGTPDQIQASDNPQVQRFTHSRAEGRITAI